MVAQETKIVSELTPEDASSTFAATRPLESLMAMLSRCMTGKRRTPAEEKVLGFYDISRAHFHSPARRSIKVPREDDECTSGYAVLGKARYGTKDAAQCFDVARKNTMTAMGYDTGKFSACLYQSRAVNMSLFRHDDTTRRIRGTIVQASHRQASCHTGTMHSTGRGHRSQDTEQDCGMSQTSSRIGT